MTKILILNLPSGRVTTDFPPVAISRIMESIDPKLDCDTSFYNIDMLRPEFAQIKEKVRAFGPQIIGFSAILTPTYKYLKELSLFLKKEFPGVIQVLGGEMSVIYKVILKNSAVDFCVIGQSEPAFSALLGTLSANNFSAADKSLFHGIKGLAFLDKEVPFFSGEETRDLAVKQINYDLLSNFTDISQYICEVAGRYYRDRINPAEVNWFFSLLNPDNLGKNLATVFSAQGCVGRCTFCHRYFKGYKVIDTALVTDYIRYLAAKYDVGMFLFQEEDFGSNAAATAKITEFLKRSGLNWAACAVRVKTVTDETLMTWKESGCVYIGCGIESCSQKMLDVIEKRARVDDNLNALRLCNKHNIATIISLLIGMPGETDATIEETISNLASVIPDDINQVYEVNTYFFQAVPGTEGYKFAKNMGLIGSSPAEEERYIEGLHNVVAGDISHYLNFTDYEKEEVLYWKDYILLELFSAYLDKHGVLEVLRRKKLKRFYYAAIYRLFPRNVRKFLLKYYIVVKHYGIACLLDILRRKLFFKKPEVYSRINRSLRLINKDFEAGKVCPISEK